MTLFHSDPPALPVVSAPSVLSRVYLHVSFASISLPCCSCLSPLICVRFSATLQAQISFSLNPSYLCSWFILPVLEGRLSSQASSLGVFLGAQWTFG